MPLTQEQKNHIVANYPFKERFFQIAKIKKMLKFHDKFAKTKEENLYKI